MTIRVSAPHYNKKGTIVTLTSPGGTSELFIDFETLRPFASQASRESLDFFFISAAVYGIDRFVERRKNSVDGWSRELHAIFPVTNIEKWQPVKLLLEATLSLLTGDYWKIEFYTSTFSFQAKALDDSFDGAFSQIGLFSGGLDSLIGALDFLKSKPKEKTIFISHNDSQMHGPPLEQKKLIDALETPYKGQFVYVPSIKVYLKKTDLVKETTFRSRSVLFIGIAQLVSNCKNVNKITVPENGSVSLNYPLSKSRRSSCSTRTTHPTVIKELQGIFERLDIDTILENPYEFLTKGQMVSRCPDQTTLLTTVDTSNSCGKRGHNRNKRNPLASHCGVCMPCVYRQAALSHFGDKKDYGNSVLQLQGARLDGELFLKSDQGRDFNACLNFLNTPLTNKEIKEELLINGVTDLDKLERYVEVVIATRAELLSWITDAGGTIIKRKLGIK